MSRHSGKNGRVKVATEVVAHLVSWSFEESANTVDLGSADDEFAEFDSTTKQWTGSMSFRLDHDAAARQTIRAGDVVAVEFYSEGDASGKTYWSGNAVVTSHGVESAHDDRYAALAKATRDLVRAPRRVRFDADEHEVGGINSRSHVTAKVHRHRTDP